MVKLFFNKIIFRYN